MLPGIRQSDYLYPVYKFDLNDEDVERFAQGPKGFHELIVPVCPIENGSARY